MDKLVIGEVARSVGQRMPWQVASRVFNALNIPPSKGWDKTIERYDKAVGFGDEAIRLFEAYRQHLVSGEKSLRMYAQKPGSRHEFAKWLHENKPSEESNRNIYFRSTEEIQLLPEIEPKLIAVEAFDSGVAAVFVSIRASEIREKLDPTKVTIGSGAALNDDRVFHGTKEVNGAASANGFKEIFGIRLNKRQCFDVVWVPHRGERIDVRVDSPAGTTMEAQSSAHQVLMKHLCAIIGSKFFAEPVNLFPVISLIYKSADDGVVSELGFATSTGSIKNERMRRSHMCLRKELYHKAGSLALDGKIEPFRISVKWELELREESWNHPELSFNGNTRMLHTPKPVLFDAEIRGCAGVSDFEFVRARIEHYLDALAKP